MAHPRRPRRSQRTLTSFLLALAFHLALFGALTLVVHWRTESDAPAVAELWGAVPPPPVEVAPPPPAPPLPNLEPAKTEADIAIKIEKKPPPEVKPEPQPEPKPEPKKVEVKPPEPSKAELKKLEEMKKLEEKKKLDEAKKLEERKKAEEQKRLEAQREAVRKSEQQRMLAQAGAGGSSEGVAGGSGRRNAEYIDLVKACIRPHIVFAVPEGTSPQVYAEFRLDVLPTGEQMGVQLIKPSGLPGYDAAAERAIRRCDPIPRRRDGPPERQIVLKMSPVELKQ